MSKLLHAANTFGELAFALSTMAFEPGTFFARRNEFEGCAQHDGPPSDSSNDEDIISDDEVEDSNRETHSAAVRGQTK